MYVSDKYRLSPLGSRNDSQLSRNRWSRRRCFIEPNYGVPSFHHLVVLTSIANPTVHWNGECEIRGQPVIELGYHQTRAVLVSTRLLICGMVLVNSDHRDITHHEHLHPTPSLRVSGIAWHTSFYSGKYASRTTLCQNQLHVQRSQLHSLQIYNSSRQIPPV